MKIKNEFMQGLACFFSEIELALLAKVKVGIAGAGGLGSNCACNLVRSGIQQLKVVDFDRVSSSNLNRQFYFYHQLGRTKVEALAENLKAINPDMTIEALEIKLERENISQIFSDCQIVVEAFDQARYKALLVECLVPDKEKLLVSASGLAGIGNSDAIVVRQPLANFFIIGDFQSSVDDGLNPYCPRVQVAAAKQADVILEYIINRRRI